MHAFLLAKKTAKDVGPWPCQSSGSGAIFSRPRDVASVYAEGLPKFKGFIFAGHAAYQGTEALALSLERLDVSRPRPAASRLAEQYSS
jgi:hypothetical protein